MADVLVHVLDHDGQFNKSSLGALSEGARLAGELGGEAHAAVIGGQAPCAALGRYGAARVYRAGGPAGVAQPVVDAMAGLMREGRFACALFGGGLLGHEAGAALAARLGAGIAVEVTATGVRAGRLVAERPVLGDSQISEIELSGPAGIIVARIGAFEALDRGAGDAPVEDLAFEPSAPATRVRMIEHGAQRGGEEADIEAAEVVVAGGREAFALCEELARAFGPAAAVGATRAVVDAGWYPYAAQVGQTGKTVAPKLYIAAGISGQIQHKVGMQGSESILAINTDARAPIFEFTDLGIVGDLHRILPRLAAALRARGDGR
jgi:electron transfer flavoprotein alpha subunit